MAESLGLDVIRTEMVTSGAGVAVSSTKIREKLEAGDIGSANQMLGYNYSLHGVVVAGQRLGRTIGFPTANMELYEPLKLVPGNGVYFVRVNVLDRTLYGMCNIGHRPTVASGNARTIETNIFDFNEDIYGLDIDIAFVSRIREEKKFNSLEELRHQLEIDRDSCLSLL
jgi:riboflavin kinase/FMN adenylyltransferase